MGQRKEIGFPLNTARNLLIPCLYRAFLSFMDIKCLIGYRISPRGGSQGYLFCRDLPQDVYTYTQKLRNAVVNVGKFPLLYKCGRREVEWNYYSKKAFAVAKAEPTFCGTLLKKSTKAQTHCNRIFEIEVNSSSSSKSISRSKFQLYIKYYSKTSRQLQIGIGLQHVRE